MSCSGWPWNMKKLLNGVFVSIWFRWWLHKTHISISAQRQNWIAPLLVFVIPCTNESTSSHFNYMTSSLIYPMSGGGDRIFRALQPNDVILFLLYTKEIPCCSFSGNGNRGRRRVISYFKDPHSIDWNIYKCLTSPQLFSLHQHHSTVVPIHKYYFKGARGVGESIPKCSRNAYIVTIIPSIFSPSRSYRANTNYLI